MQLKTVTIALLGLLAIWRTAFADTATIGNFVQHSQTVPTTATTVIQPLASGVFKRIVIIDTAIQSGSTSTVTTWCAWGTAAQNPAVVGSNGFPLNAGIDDSGYGVNQNGVNCIQPSGAHYVRIETY